MINQSFRNLNDHVQKRSKLFVCFLLCSKLAPELLSTQSFCSGLAAAAAADVDRGRAETFVSAGSESVVRGFIPKEAIQNDAGQNGEDALVY